SKFRSAVADLASVVRDIPKDLLEGEDVGQFRRSRRVAYSAASGLILTVCTLAASLVELQKARMAKKQQQLMEKSARHRSYLANVLAADIALNAGKTEDAARHLSASAFEREAWEWRNLDLRRDSSLLTIAGRKGALGSVESVVFSPDGTRIASGSSDHTVRIWNAATGQLLRTMFGHEEVVEHVAFSPDGNRIASGSWDDTVRVWDAHSGKSLLTLKGHQGGVSTVS